jgi:hypothetical protein
MDNITSEPLLEDQHQPEIHTLASDVFQESNYPLAFIEIFSLTVGTGALALPKAMESLNSPILGIVLTIAASVIVLFAHCSILRASPNNTKNIQELPKKYCRNEDMFIIIANERLNEVVSLKNKRFDTYCSCFKPIFELTRWMLLWIYTIAYIDILKTYLDIWTEWDLKTKLESVPPMLQTSWWKSVESIVFQKYDRNPTWWLIGMIMIVWILTVMTLIFDEENDNQNFKLNSTFRHLDLYFNLTKKGILAVAKIATLSALLGMIYEFAKKIDLNTFWSDLLVIPQNEGLGFYDGLLIYVGSIFPILCISFFNHLGSTSILYKYIYVDPEKLKPSHNIDVVGLEDRQIKGRYNFFPEHGRCWGFEKSRMFVMTILQVIVTLLYILIPVIALLGSGGLVEGNVLISLTSDSNPMVTALLALSGFGVWAPLSFLYTPRLVQPVYRCCLRRCCYFQNHLVISCVLSIVLTFLALLICFNVAAFVPGGLDLYMGLVGSLCASWIILIYPALIHLATLADEAKEDSMNPPVTSFPKASHMKDNVPYHECILVYLKRLGSYLCQMHNLPSDSWKILKYFGRLCLSGLRRNWTLCDIGWALCSLFMIVIGVVILVFGTLWNVKRFMEAS